MKCETCEKELKKGEAAYVLTKEGFLVMYLCSLRCFQQLTLKLLRHELEDKESY